MKKIKNLVAVFLIVLTLFILPSCDSSLAEPTDTVIGVVALTLLSILSVEIQYLADGSYAGVTYSESGSTGTLTFSNCKITDDTYNITVILNGKMTGKTSGSNYTVDVTATINSIPYDVYLAYSETKGITAVKVDGVSYDTSYFNSSSSSASIISSLDAVSYDSNELKELVLSSGLGEINFL